MNTAFEEIVNIKAIGTQINGNINEVLLKAKLEQLSPAASDKERVLFLAIDFQNDFMDGGALGVPGSVYDAERAAKFIYKHMGKITDIAVSLDTHQPLQIFHSAWWEDENGAEPAPYTIITSDEVNGGKWSPKFYKDESKEYVSQLEKLGKKQLCIWPYHCIQGTTGCALEGQLSNMIYFHAAARKTGVKTIVKGLSPVTEMYGIFRPEYSPRLEANVELLEDIASYDKIFIAGEAKSHCVLASLHQLTEYFSNHQISCDRIYVLEDCMTSIPGFEEDTERQYETLVKEYGIHIVKSTDEVI